MEIYQIAFIVALFLIFLALFIQSPSGFVNNDIYFMAHDKSMDVDGYLVQPSLIHKINIPSEW